MTILNKLARPLLAAPFVTAGLDALIKPKAHREPARKLWGLTRKFIKTTPAGQYEPSDAVIDTTTRVTGLVVTIAGIQLARSRAPRSAALILGLSQIPMALANNPVWEKKPLAERRRDISGLLAAAGLIGGALIASTDRSGKPSLTWRAARLRERAAQNASEQLEKITPSR